jgi:ADP-ribose pyrophosphatase YjhB (NUDIX family)
MAPFLETRMTTDRRFCRFTRTSEGHPFGLRWDEPGGLCLSTFLILSEAGRPSSVLVGRLNPAAPWDHLEGLDAERIEAHRGGWVLPASHLLLRESPDESARRILSEMLGGAVPSLQPARVVSEVYTPRRAPETHNHWDLRFLYRGTLRGPPPSVPAVWNDLRFVDVHDVRRSEFARSHDEVLEEAGLPVPQP